jgi:hypothetical protein
MTLVLQLAVPVTKDTAAHELLMCNAHAVWLLKAGVQSTDS